MALCVIAACLLAMPLLAHATGSDIVASGTCGENLTWALHNDGRLVISGTGKMMDESFLTAAPWDGYLAQIKTVVIETGVTDIATNAFADCVNLKTVSIADSVTRIGDSAFAGCIKLETVKLPNSVTAIGWYAFYGCSALESATLSNKLTEIPGWMFYGCTELRFISIPTGVESVGEYAFADCASMNTVSVPTTVKSLGAYAFSGCLSLKTLNLPESIKALGDGVFAYCGGLKNVAIPKNVSSVGIALFEGCSSLESMTIPSGFTAVPTQMFKDCTALKSVSLPNGVTAIGNNAFWGCTSLESISIPNSVTAIGSAVFYNCSALKTVAVPQGVGTISGYLFAGCTALESVSLPAGATSMGDYVFYQCEKLKNVSIPAGVTTIGQYAFFGCSGLTDIALPAGVTAIGDYAFYQCAALREVKLHEGITTIGISAFSRCDSLESVSVPKSVTEIGRYAFLRCQKLKEIRVDSNNPNYSSDSAGVLFNKDKTRLIQAPGAISGSYTTPESVSIIGGYAFMYCDGLEKITFAEGLTDIGGNAFTYCTGLTEIRFRGDAPVFSGDVLYDVTATAYYPAGNASWTEEIRQNYGGTITWVAEGPVENPVTWVQATTSLEGNIGLNFYVKLHETLVNDGNTRMRFVFDGKTIDVPLQDALLSGEQYRFTCPINAKNMADEITAQIVTSAGPVGEAKTLTVMDYCNYMIRYSDSTELVKLMKAMLNYGAAAQVLFNHHTDDLANASLDDADKVLTDVDASAYAHSVTGSEDGIQVVNATLLLETETSIRIYFKLTGSKSIDQYTFRVDGQEVQPQKNGDQYFLEISDIAAQDLEEMHTVTVGGITVRYGGLSYVNQVIKNPQYATQGLTDAVKALFTYHKMAEDYFN